MSLIAAVAIAVIFGAGVQLMVRRDIIKLAAGALMISNAAVLMLIASGLGGREVPMVGVAIDEAADPLVQALAITALVIGFGTSVLLLRLGLAVERSHSTLILEDLVAAEVEEGEEDGA